MDASSQQPVPFASVGLLHSPLGTVSNELGVFRFIVAAREPTDSLLVSRVGFTSYRVRLASVATSHPLRIALLPQVVVLQAAAVVGYTPQTLLKQAVRRTHAHLLSPALLKSYYRELVRVNDTYPWFADGLVEYRVAANPRRLFKPDVQVRVTQSRAKKVPVADQQLRDLPTVADVEQAINGYERDSNLRSNFLDSTDFAFYQYELREPAGRVEEPYYEVAFTPATHDSQHLFQGTVRINKQTGCLQAIDAELPADLKQYAKSVNVLGLNFKEGSMHKHLEYRPFQDQCYLSFMRVDFGVDITHQREKFTYLVSTALVVTEALPQAPPIPGPERYRGRTLFKRGTQYSYPFWQQANSIVATPAEEAIIADLSPSE